MLQTIRDHTQGWIAGIIISIIILSFALWGIHSYFVGGGNNYVVAAVNGTDITKEQLSSAYERIRRQIQVQYGSTHPITSKDEAALKNRALQSLVDIEVLKQASFSQGYRISDQQIENYLQRLPEFQVDGRFSVVHFQEILAGAQLSIAEFVNLLRTSLLIDQPKIGILYSSFALPKETKETMALINQDREISYLQLPLKYFISQPITISQNKILSYYNEHKNEFMTPEQVSVDYIQLSLNDIAATIKPSLNELQNLYNENRNAYKTPMTWKLDNILIPTPPNADEHVTKEAEDKANKAYEALSQGQSFSKVAKSFTRQNFKNNNLVTLSELPDELQKSVSELTQPNQFSKPIKTNIGYVIIKALAIQKPMLQSFEMVKNKVRENYVRQHAEEKFGEWRDKLADLAYEHPDSLDAASKSLDLPIKTSDFFIKGQPGKDIAQYQKVRNAAFSSDVLTMQNNSDVLQVSPETLFVIHLKQHITSSLLPLSSVKTQIENKLKNQTAEQQAEKVAFDIKNKLQAGNDPRELARPYQFKWVNTGYIGRYSTKVDSAILDAAFRLPHPNQFQKMVYTVTRIPSGYAIVILKAVRNGSNEDKKQYSVFAEQVQSSNGIVEYELYKQSQINRAKVKVLI